MRGLPAPIMTCRSLNETFSGIRSAARGAGLPWGLADECGYAARWLLQRHLPLEPVLEALEQRQHLCAPDPDSQPLCGGETDKVLCPFATGALLSDEAPRFARAGRCELSKTAWPVLLSPFVSGWREWVGLKWGDAQLFLRQDEVWVSAQAEALVVSRAEHVIIQMGKRPPGSAHRADFSPPAPVFWQRLSRLAARTHVPSDEYSRRDAGAGLTDND